MIGSLRGVLGQKAPDRVIVDLDGVGYLVHVPLSTYYELGQPGDEVSLRIHTYVREDAIVLYGFVRETEQLLFERLITISGIGPKLAVTILSGMEIEDLALAIADQDVARLSTIPGVGVKTAERLALELKDKMEGLIPAAAERPRAARDDVLSALINLGYRRRDAERALKKLEDPAADFETLLRQTLRVLAG